MSRFSLLFVFLFFSCSLLFADNGRVTHLAWTENTDGSIQNSHEPNLGLHFFEQRNQFVNYKDPNNPLFKIRYTWLGIEWTLIHFIALFLTILIQLLTFRRINRKMAESRFFKRWSYRFLKLFLWGAVIAGNGTVIWAVAYYNTEVHFRFHQLSDFKNANLSTIETGRHDRTYFLPTETNKLRFQLYRKAKGKWYTQRALPVLHFEQNTNGRIHYQKDTRYVKFHPDSARIKAPTQLIVLHQKNQLGVDTTLYFRFHDKQLIPYQIQKDRAQRVLLFINGYRPVSNEQDPEKAFLAINNKGLEHPRSKNLISSVDLFNYWPQEKFTSIVEQKIRPHQTYYADGHHSVRTSNHGSLLKFVSGAALYPKPCKGKHYCATTTIANQQKVRTYSLLATVPNYSGFHKRYLSGQQAGRNLLQALSANGNQTQNDTLYAVSHSMGHAYLMGMASVLRGKMQLCAYFAFAPENPKGKVFRSRYWQVVYQYGTKLYGPQRHAPCQQDGVAPQWRMGGLAPEQQIAFPKQLSSRLGYFSSHYIGYYDWVLAIPKGKPGYLGRP